MPVVSTEHPDVKISNCIGQCMEFAKQYAHTLDESDRPIFYWRLIHFTDGRIVAYHSSFQIPAGSNPRIADAVDHAISQFKRSASIRFKDSPAQEFTFYKRLHRALCEHAYTIDDVTAGE